MPMFTRVSSGYGHDRSASFKVGTGSKIGTVVMTMVPNMGFGNPNYEELFFRSVILSTEIKTLRYWVLASSKLSDINKCFVMEKEIDLTMSDSEDNPGASGSNFGPTGSTCVSAPPKNIDFPHVLSTSPCFKPDRS